MHLKFACTQFNSTLPCTSEADLRDPKCIVLANTTGQRCFVFLLMLNSIDLKYIKNCI